MSFSFSEWFETNVKGFILKDIFGMPWYVGLAVALLVVVGVGLFISGRQKWTTRKLAYAALCVAVAFLLSCVRLYRMPSGGSVVLCAILPLVAFSFYCGFREGLVACTAYGLLQIAQGAWIIHPIQGLLDYIVAYAALSLGALAAKLPIAKRWKLPAGIVIACLARYFVHILSALMFFSQDAVEAGQLPLIYAATYNLFLFPEMILSAIVALVPGFDRIFKPLAEANAK